MIVEVSIRLLRSSRNNSFSDPCSGAAFGEDLPICSRSFVAVARFVEVPGVFSKELACRTGCWPGHADVQLMGREHAAATCRLVIVASPHPEA